MTKRIFYTVLLAALGLNLFVGAQIYLNSAQAAEKDDYMKQFELFTRVLERVRSDYVDGEKLSYQDLIYGALRGMLSTLDPHSEFMEPQKYDDLRKDTEGSFGGIGVVIGLRDNFLTVIAPMEDTPGWKAGILSGDRIIKINGASTEKLTLPDAVKKLRGEPGTDVEITIYRPSTSSTRDIRIVRDIIKVDTVKDLNGKREFPLGDDKIGYVRLTQFGEQTAADLEDALKKLEAQGMRALILDLRGNPGGLLDQAVAVAERFVPKGQLIVSTEGRVAPTRQEYKASGRHVHPDYPMVVLVNGGSASASEIVAGCLQDLKRAVILGEQTFGKGSVQSIQPLPDGSALRLTTAKYYTPSHKVIHEKGITPDILVPLSIEEEEALLVKRTPGVLETLDEERRQRVLAARDTQLERAFDLLKGLTLFTQRANGAAKVAARR
jgi:carboxyl-terminal processing protease